MLLLAAYAGCAFAEPLVEQTAADGFASLTILESQELEQFRGRAADANITNNVNVSVSGTQNLDANVRVDGFNVDTVQTGAVSFDANAINNFHGVGLFNIVTGNNNGVTVGLNITINLM